MMNIVSVIASSLPGHECGPWPKGRKAF